MRENKAKVKRIVAKATKQIEIGQKITFGNQGGLQNPQDPPFLATGLDIDLLKTSLLPECRRLYPGSDFEFLQDIAPLHLAKAMHYFIRQNTTDFIAADKWASYSPVLKPLD